MVSGLRFYLVYTLAGSLRSLRSGDIASPSGSPKVFSFDIEDNCYDPKTEAAAYILNDSCIAYIDPSKNNPLSPLPSQLQNQHREHHQYRLQSDTNPYFLDNLVGMKETRCSRCHRFKKDPPNPDLGHEGSHTESKCKLAHHPFPCDFIDDDTVCEYHTDENTGVPDYETLAREFEDKLGVQNEELVGLIAEMQEMRRMVASMKPTANPGSAVCSSSTDTTVTTSITTPQMSVIPPTAFSSAPGNL